MIKLLKRSPPKSNHHRFRTFDLLATLVAVVRSDGTVLFANAALEDVVGTSRRTIEGSQIGDSFTEPQALAQALAGARGNKFAALRYDAWLKRLSHEPIPVHVIVTQTELVDEIVVELLPLEQQARQDREERLADQAQANKELIRNLAHEIKNPLGGIRGAAQLLELEIAERGLRAPNLPGGRPPEGAQGALGRPGDSLKEYTQVIIHEADRLQSLVDRLLAPHRRARVVETVNIHEVCERVRALIAVEYSRGLKVVREYDVSIPEFRADREQLIQAVLNIAQNACQAMAERIAAGDARLTFMTRIARNITFGRRRYRLALELHVIDNGPGVPDSIKDRIFYPLVSGREGGSGLGLTLAQTFVQQHFGLIDVESSPGHTDFTILIPLP